MTHDRLPPDWQRPAGVAEGTWRYVHERAIARHYDGFVAETPLCRLDQAYVFEQLAADETLRAAASEPENQLDPRSVRGRRVLDLGCGTGRLARPLAEAGYDVVAIDLSQPMLEELRRRPLAGSVAGSVAGAGRVWPLRANLVQLESLRDKIADHAVCLFSTLGMIQGAAHRVRFLRHVARAVRPGGKLVLHVHRCWAALREPGGLGVLGRNWMGTWFRRGVEFGDATYAYRGLPDMFMHRFTARQLRRELRRAGWACERFDRVNLDGTALTPSTWKASGFLVVARR